MADLDPWFLENLVCPVDGMGLSWDSYCNELRSESGRAYPVVDGVPVMLPEGLTMTFAELTLEQLGTAPLYLESALLPTMDLKCAVLELAAARPKIDALVQYLVAATGGLGYAHLVGRLIEYPIPEIRLPTGAGKLLLDVGCSWGRWCAAAARKDYKVVGIDPSLAAVMAARRMMKSLGLQARFVVGDARCLPFKSNSFDQVFSYSVLQHLAPENATRAVAEVGRVLKAEGECLIQMPTRFGLRCLYNQSRRGWREAQGFEVRYWSLRDLETTFQKAIGQAKIIVDCFFGIGWQVSDVRLMPWWIRCVVMTSEILRKASRCCPALKWVADSVYIQAVKPREGGSVD